MTFDAKNTNKTDPTTGDVEARRRRWYHLRPEPRCRADLMGYNYTWWTVIGATIVVFIAIFV
jgi:hypothetical protein